MSDHVVYRQILRASSIMGGSHATTYVIALVRVKVVAILLGPGGVGLVSLFSAVLAFIAMATGLGIARSGTRDIASAMGRDDLQAVARTAAVIKRASWVAGGAGWVVAATFLVLFRQWDPGNTIGPGPLVVLGAVVLFTIVGEANTSVLQGLRRVGDIARLNIVAALFSTLMAVVIYAWAGVRGIIPVLVGSAFATFAASAYFLQRASVPKCPRVRWRDVGLGIRHLGPLGTAFVLSGLLTAGVDLAARGLIERVSGLEAVGIYQAAWTLSGMFALFVLTAMGTDFYPRLAAVIDDRPAAVRAVNAQAEVGILLALPGLALTMSLAPWVVWLFYSAEFSEAADLLPWFVVGVFGRVVSWPLAYVQLAQGAARLFAATETAFAVLQVVLLLTLLPRFGMVGAAYAFAISYGVYVVAMFIGGRRLIGFRWSPRLRRVLGLATGVLGSQLLLMSLDLGGPGRLLQAGIVGLTVVGCLLALARHTGWSQRRRLGGDA